MEEQGNHLCSAIHLEGYQSFSSFQMDPSYSTYLALFFMSVVHIPKLQNKFVHERCFKNKNILG